MSQPDGQNGVELNRRKHDTLSSDKCLSRQASSRGCSRFRIVIFALMRADPAEMRGREGADCPLRGGDRNEPSQAPEDTGGAKRS
jgi:hypothetical protein